MGQVHRLIVFGVERYKGRARYLGSDIAASLIAVGIVDQQAGNSPVPFPPDTMNQGIGQGRA